MCFFVKLTSKVDFITSKYIKGNDQHFDCGNYEIQICEIQTALLLPAAEITISIKLMLRLRLYYSIINTVNPLAP